MKELLCNSLFFGAAISIIAYQIGLALRKKWKLALFNPIFIAAALVIVLLIVADIDYEGYYRGAKYIDYLLTPATVCFAIPLYEQLPVLKKHAKAVLVGVISGVLTSAVGVLACAILFRLDYTMYATLLPKSITSAIGMAQSEILGGIATLTVAIIVATGVFGNMIAETVCRICRITEPVAKGVAIGTSSHAGGTAKAMEMGETEGAVSSLSVVVAGLITIVVAAIFAQIGL